MIPAQPIVVGLPKLIHGFPTSPCAHGFSEPARRLTTVATTGCLAVDGDHPGWQSERLCERWEAPRTDPLTRVVWPPVPAHTSAPGGRRLAASHRITRRANARSVILCSGKVGSLSRTGQQRAPRTLDKSTRGLLTGVARTRRTMHLHYKGHRTTSQHLHYKVAMHDESTRTHPCTHSTPPRRPSTRRPGSSTVLPCNAFDHRWSCVISGLQRQSPRLDGDLVTSARAHELPIAYPAIGSRLHPSRAHLCSDGSG
ncbi:hypothetical protein EHYA_07447 [Embleya hyalina]|uniref:Uncharacterized protein n=1 Tax=Embleya hyalina TaxID=516124 RepID=A0A401YZ00_9ACTN|nr:hypothetical protein EHYA_07447 [Embleya hyalina]